MGLRVNLSHCFKQIARSQPMHSAVLQEFERHLRETIRGEHTLQELAEVYCLTEPQPRWPETEDEAAELADNGRNTGGKSYR